MDGSMVSRWAAHDQASSNLQKRGLRPQGIEGILFAGITFSLLRCGAEQALLSEPVDRRSVGPYDLALPPGCRARTYE